jgi:hypothetical protein
MLLRVGLLSMITGAVFIAMAWLDPTGPLAILLGSASCAVALESRLDAEDWQHTRVPQAVRTIAHDDTARGAAA